MSKKRAILAAVALMCAAALASCGVGEMRDKSASITYPSNGEIYPMKCSDSLTVWSNSFPGGDMDNIPLGEEWRAQTGVNAEFVQPMNGSQEALSVMIASGDYPDIIIAGLYGEPGGVQKFAEDDVIIPLDDKLKEYSPAYSKVLDDDPNVRKQIICDDGKIYCYTNLAPEERAYTSSGIAIRKDLLDKAGLAVPETIDEWHTALTAFKQQGMDAPLSYDLMYWERYAGIFTGAYGVKANFYLDDNGKVHYGILEPEMKEAVSTLAQWYSEGLIDRNIVKVADLDANILNSQTGATCTWAGSGIGKYLNAMKDKAPSFDLSPAKYPVLKKGDMPKFGYREFRVTTFNNAFITTACKNVELAMRFLDYGYTEKGHMLFNFGKEGESYTMVDGNPVYTDLVLHNKDGLSISDVMKKYIFAIGSGPFVSDKRYLEQYYQYPQQREALETWGYTTAPANTIPLVNFTTEESSRLATIMSNVETTTDEMMYKYIMGLEPMDNFDKLPETIRSFGVEEAIQIYQAAVDRYNAR